MIEEIVTSLVDDIGRNGGLGQTHPSRNPLLALVALGLIRNWLNQEPGRFLKSGGHFCELSHPN